MLESFKARGDDGGHYTVRGYEHLARLDGMPAHCEWQPTGICEYKLASGERVCVDTSGTMTIGGRGVRLQRESDIAAA
jgi:hypothetical protein